MKVWIKVPYHLKTLWIFGGTELEGNPVVHVNSNELKSIISIAIDFQNNKKLKRSLKLMSPVNYLRNYFSKAKKT